MIEFLNGLFVRLTTHEEKEEGQGMVEYALILVLVSIVAIVALTALGPQITTIFNEVGAALGTR